MDFYSVDKVGAFFKEVYHFEKLTIGNSVVFVSYKVSEKYEAKR